MTEVGGWEELDVEAVIGSGKTRFAEVRERLLTWRIHLGAGLQVLDAQPRVSPGATARLRTRILLVGIDAPVKIWSVIDEPGRAGFAYTTLPGHPEEGFEEFLVTLTDAGEVLFRIRARSRPSLWWARALPPVTHAVQRRITRRYLAAARA